MLENFLSVSNIMQLGNINDENQMSDKEIRKFRVI